MSQFAHLRAPGGVAARAVPPGTRMPSAVSAMVTAHPAHPTTHAAVPSATARESGAAARPVHLIELLLERLALLEVELPEASELRRLARAREARQRQGGDRHHHRDQRAGERAARARTSALGDGMARSAWCEHARLLAAAMRRSRRLATS